MISRKIEIRREIQGQGHIIQAERRHAVGGFQDCIKVVRVPIVADVRVNP